MSSVTPPMQCFFLKVTAPQGKTVVNTNPIRVSGIADVDAVVSVKGELIDIDEQGNFVVLVELEERPNAIQVVSSGHEGK